jgi:hypothetical protein
MNYALFPPSYAEAKHVFWFVLQGRSHASSALFLLSIPMGIPSVPIGHHHALPFTRELAYGST